jgi:hypothetical protein
MGMAFLEAPRHSGMSELAGMEAQVMASQQDGLVRA